MIIKEYKISIIKLVKFMIIFCIVDFTLGMVSKQIFFSQQTGKYARSTHAIKNTEAKILIFGSSHAHRHYIPEVFEKELGKTCYNAGAEGQQLLYHTALQSMIVNRTKPELVILNIDEDFLYYSKEAYDRLSDLHPYYTGYKDILKPILSLESELIDIKMFFNAYQTNSTIMHAIRYYIAPQVDYKGYRPLFGKINPSKTVINEKESKINSAEDIDQNFVTALQTFIDTAKKNDIKLIFVTSPAFNRVDHSRNTSFTNIKSIAEKENILFYDYFNSLKFINKPELFHDPSHLNDDGARLFMRDLIREIRKSE